MKYILNLFIVLFAFSIFSAPVQAKEEFVPHLALCIAVEQTTLAYAKAKKKLPTVRKEQQRICRDFEKDENKYYEAYAKDPDKHWRFSRLYEIEVAREMAGWKKKER